MHRNCCGVSGPKSRTEPNATRTPQDSGSRTVPIPRDPDAFKEKTEMSRGDEPASEMTVRQEFAKTMMHGYLSNCETWKEWSQDEMQKQAVIVADELLAELEKRDAPE